MMQLNDLSILCVTKNEPHAALSLQRLDAFCAQTGAELNILVDAELNDNRHVILDGVRGPHVRIGFTHSAGYIESVLDDAIAFTTREYILRIDDDEALSPALDRWLKDGMYRQ